MLGQMQANIRAFASRLGRLTTDDTTLGTVQVPYKPTTVADAYRIANSVVRKANDTGTVRVPARGKADPNGRRTVIRGANRQYRSVDVQDVVQDMVGDAFLRSVGVCQVVAGGAGAKKADPYGFRTTRKGPVHMGIAFRTADQRRNKAAGYWQQRYEQPANDGFGWVTISEQAANDLVAARKGVILPDDAGSYAIDQAIREGLVPVRVSKIIVRHLEDTAPETSDRDFTVRDLVGKMLAGLTAQDRLIMALFGDGFNHEQVAARIGVHRTTVLRTIQRVRKAQQAA